MSSVSDFKEEKDDFKRKSWTIKSKTLWMGNI